MEYNWHYQEKSDIYTHIVRDEDNNMICHLSQDDTGKYEAMARFIANAPKILNQHDKLLKALNKYGQHDTKCELMWKSPCPGNSYSVSPECTCDFNKVEKLIADME